MPKQVLPDEVAFGAFERRILEKDFREMTRQEFRSEYVRQGLEPPYPRDGREVGFTFEANGYKVVVWTTYLRDAKMARKSDAGRVLIRSGDRVLYHDHPKHRTKNFLDNLFLSAIITQARVLNRPLCPKCHAYMHIKQGKGLKSRFWECAMLAHPRRVRLSWDHGLSPELLAEVKRIRQKREPYRKKLARQGKKPGVAMLKRRLHKVHKPQNRV
jgi:hypothetical protein